MSTNMSQDPEKNIEALGRGEAPVLEQLAQMTIDTRARSGLDDETFTLVRIAALVASDAAPASYLLNLGAAAKIGVPMEEIQGTLVAVAPIVGTARVVSAAGNMLRAMGTAASFDDEDDD
ncbi:MAG TPA: carboxymuconolactone decarboxylase family protein [Candidatus Limnocylindrales bacterium]|jgi:alkylhydroperoxidase/carboxymuconolactone decarboxylase family protein YurZ